MAYDSPEQFELHMRSAHNDLFPDDEITLLTEVSAQPLHPTLEHCPFCQQPTAEGIDDHVGHHLREVALLSLPWPENASEGSQEERKSSSADEELGARETVLDFQDWPPPLFEDSVEKPSSEEDELGPSSEKEELERLGRLELWEFVPQVADQHTPLCHDLEVLEDRTMETFACIKYHADSARAVACLFCEPLKKFMNRAMVHTHGNTGEDQQYLPADELDNIITTAHIYGELMRSGLTSNLRHVCQQIRGCIAPPNVSTTRKKLFAILCLIDRAADIVWFIDGGLSDSDLPLVTTSLNHGEAIRGKYSPPPRTTKAFELWAQSDRDAFQNHQWKFLAPFFSASSTETRHYVLEDHHVLPFVDPIIRPAISELGQHTYGGSSQLDSEEPRRRSADTLPES
jgi:hypothetical protein